MLVFSKNFVGLNKVEAGSTHPLHVAVQTEDVEDPVGVHLHGIQSVHHDHGRLGVGAVLPGRRGRGSITWPVTPCTTSSHWWTHAAAFVGRRTITLIVAMVTTSCRIGWAEKNIYLLKSQNKIFNFEGGRWKNTSYVL